MTRPSLLLLTVFLCGCVVEAPGEFQSKTRSGVPAELAGRHAEPAQRCVRLHELRGNRPAGNGAIIFEGPGTLVYLNRFQNSCPQLGFGHVLQTRSTNGFLCEGQHVEVVDPDTGIGFGACQLGPFIPQRKMD